MVARLRYALLFALALAAIYLGLWPSLLTIGALLGVPLAVLGLAGTFAPRFVEQWRWLRRTAAVGSAVLGAELVLVLAWLAWTPRRPVLLVLEQPTPARVRIIYSVVDGAPRQWWRWERRFEVPSSGLLHTQYAMDEGWYRPDNPHPLRIVVRGADAQLNTVPGAWVGGGTTQAGACRLAYDEFAVGNVGSRGAQAPGAEIRSEWLDSLEAWSVTCHSGRLYRAEPGASQTLRRTAPACYYDRAGGLSCGSAP